MSEDVPGRDLLQAEIERHRNAKDYHTTIVLNNGKIVFRKFYVRQGVLQPDTMTTKPFADYLVRQHPDKFRGKRAYELMCGCGLLGLTAAMLGAEEVIMSDISPLSVYCAQENITKYGLDNHCTVVEADLFDHPIYDDGQADVAICNAPFSHGEPRPGDYLEAAFLGGTKLVPAFFAGIHERLKPGAPLFMPYRTHAGSFNDPGVLGTQYGFRVVSVEPDSDAGGVQFGGPLLCYHLERL